MDIENKYGYKADFDAAVNFMDDDIREELAASGNFDSGSEQEFFDAYCAAHLEKFGEEFELAKPNPVW